MEKVDRDGKEGEIDGREGIKEGRKEESQMEVRAKRGDESGFENERILNIVY